MRLFPSLTVVSCLTLALLVVGAVGFRIIEKWSAVDCIYASAGILTTVGITVHPTKRLSLLFTALLNVSSLGVTGLWLGEISELRRAWMRRTMRLSGEAPSVRADAVILFAAAGVTWAIASVYFALVETWPLPEASFFTFACATGLGMGELAPVTAKGRLGLVVYLFANMGVALNACAATGQLLCDAARPLFETVCKAQIRSATAAEMKLAGSDGD